MSLYWKIFRLVFVLFMFYLLGDVFYRWDGVKYYASFSDFIPSIALVLTLLSLTAVLSSIIIWAVLKIVDLLFMRIGFRVNLENVLLAMLFLGLSGIVVLFLKKAHFLGAITITVKLMAAISIIVSSILLTYSYRNRLNIILSSLTPLVWLFGCLVILSVPVVAYNTDFNNTIEAKTSSVPSSSEHKRPNIILVTFDALTTRDMSMYGYHRQTTPFMTEWAKDATVFTGAEAADNYTVPTTFSLMTGKRVWTHRYYNPNERGFGENHENLANVLKDRGYYNIAYSANELATVKKLAISKSIHVTAKSFDLKRHQFLLPKLLNILDRFFGDKILLHDWFLKTDFPVSIVLRNIFQKGDIAYPEVIFNKFLSLLDAKMPEPYFAWLHIAPPHLPYLPPEPYIGMYNPSPEYRTLKSNIDVEAGDFPDSQGIEILRARYNETIRFCDKQFEDFIEQLKARGILENTTVIVSADHGESFEHNYLMHGGWHLYEQVTNIPLIIKEPGQSKGRVINDFIEQIDIPATILDLAGIEIPVWMEGRSLMPLIRGENVQQTPVYSMSLHTNRKADSIKKGTFAVWEGDYKLIHYLEENKSLLFNLRDDPGETENLFEMIPDVGKHLLTMIQGGIEKANKRIKNRK